MSMPHKNEWVMKIKNELTTFPDTSSQSTHWRKRSIYRIPVSVTDHNRRAYKPQIVSFGPYHHGAENLRPMEEHKHRALLHFLKRANKPFESFVEELAPVVEDLKAAYERLEGKWDGDNTDAFLELMIVDGCFVLELLRTMTMETGDEKKEDDEDYAANDPIFSRHGKLYIVPYLKRDMLMLENQIPMLVLEKMAAVQTFGSRPIVPELIRMILNFFSQSLTPKQLPQFQTPRPLHILHIYRTSLLLQDPHLIKHNKHIGHKDFAADRAGGDEIIRSATELNEAGIRIVKSGTRSLKDISFRRGILRLPLIVVDDALESLYLNLIAFERFHVGAGHEITAYIFFMDNIIDSARDVSLLHSCGIIQNALGSDKAVANLFNSLSKDITLDPDSSLDAVHRRVSAYCQKPWNRWRANLMHTYFTNPWAVLSVLAALVLFALTILQTVYSVLSYVKPA